MSAACHHRCQGSAMSEFVLVLPVLVVILMLVIFFGRGMVRVQHAMMVAHYELWQTLQPVRYTDGRTHPAVPSSDHAGNQVLNDLFFAGNAATIQTHHRISFPYQAADLLIEAADWRGPIHGDLVDALHHGPGSHRGQTVEAKVTHVEPVELWQRFSPRIIVTQNRFGPPWSYVHGLRVEHSPLGENWRHDHGPGAVHGGPNILAAVRDVFYPEWDQQLASLASGDGAAAGNPLASRIRRAYLGQPVYRGPEVSF